jgi:hypothetical protein
MSTRKFLIEIYFDYWSIVTFVCTLTCVRDRQVQYGSRCKINVGRYCGLLIPYPFKDEAQTALFKDPVRTAL